MQHVACSSTKMCRSYPRVYPTSWYVVVYREFPYFYFWVDVGLWARVLGAAHKEALADHPAFIECVFIIVKCRLCYCWCEDERSVCWLVLVLLSLLLSCAVFIIDRD